MSRRHLAVLVLVSVAASSGTALAKVTVKGKVEFWNQLENKYQPAKQVHVEVEGDWFWRSDPDVLTDDEGNYSASVGNPPWWWDNYDGVDIEVYAEKTNHFEVYDSMWSWWPYHAISKETNNVKGGKTVVIDLKIGGPQNNIGEAYYRSASETANAFIIIQKMLEHKRKLQSFGWTGDDFDEVEVIVPATSPAGTSYYNNITGYINLVLDSAGWSGTGNWKTLPAGDSYLADIKDFYELVQHEFTHNIHDEMTGVRLPMGLDMPSTHNVSMETNRWIAFTEGLAAFLPLATNDVGSGRNALELSRPSEGGAKQVNMPTSGDHWAMEGEVAGVFWDIFDNNMWEVYRKTITKTENGAHSLPANFNKNLRWRDSVSDPTLMKTRSVLKDTYEAWPVQTIEVFLKKYISKNPSEKHGVKAIAHNRSIRVGVPGQHAPYLANGPSFKRINRQLQFKIRAVEEDPEDRAALRVVAMLGSGRLYPIQMTKTQWSGSACDMEFNINLNQTWVDYYEGTPGRKFWLVLTDDIDLKAYQFDWIDNFKVATLDIGKDETTVSEAFTIVAAIQPVVVAQVSIPNTPVAAVPARPDASLVAGIRRDLSTLKAEKRQFGDNQRKQVRLERALYKFARTRNLLSSDLTASAVVQTRRDLSRQPVSPTVKSAAIELASVKDRLLKGQLDTSSLKPDERNALMQLKSKLVSSDAVRVSLDKKIKGRLATISSAVNSPKIPSTLEQKRALQQELKTANATFTKAVEELTIERFEVQLQPTGTAQQPKPALPRKRVPLRDR